jgi:hypothetical protein
MTDSRDVFSAKVGRFFSGPTDAAISGIRDVLICTTGAGSVEEYKTHPPIASPLAERLGGERTRLDLGSGLRIDRLSREEAELVMNACTPRGHYFHPIRQFGQRYSFIRDVDLGEWEHNPYRWDADDAIWDALTLSRLIRDNAYSTQYAARIADYEDGEQMVIYTQTGESKHVYRLRHDRDWLDMAEGAELCRLFSAYRERNSPLPPRVRRAMWRTEYASWVKWADLSLPLLVGGLEALLQTEHEQATKQFVRRVPALAEEVGVEEVTRKFCDDMYDTRSQWVHGARVKLFAAGPEAQPGQAPTEEQWSVLGKVARLQDVLRSAVRRAVEDDQFADVFVDDERIRERWPI